MGRPPCSTSGPPPVTSEARFAWEMAGGARPDRPHGKFFFRIEAQHQHGVWGWSNLASFQNIQPVLVGQGDVENHQIPRLTPNRRRAPPLRSRFQNFGVPSCSSFRVNHAPPTDNRMVIGNQTSTLPVHQLFSSAADVMPSFHAICDTPGLRLRNHRNHHMHPCSCPELERMSTCPPNISTLSRIPRKPKPRWESVPPHRNRCRHPGPSSAILLAAVNGDGHVVARAWRDIGQQFCTDRTRFPAGQRDGALRLLETQRTAQPGARLHVGNKGLQCGLQP